MSKNSPAIRVVLDIGLRTFIDTAVKFGVYKSVRNANLAMALGAGDTHLLDLTSAFAKLFNGGKSLTPIFIDRVQDRDGRTIFKTDLRACAGCANAEWVPDLMPPDIPDEREQLADPVAVYQIVHLMEGVVKFGSGWMARIPGRTIGGKTGTSNDAKDVWFIGGTPDLVVGVFLGYDHPRSLGDNTTGGMLAAPIFRDFMEQALKGQKDVAFRVPDGVSFVQVNRHTGRRATASDRAADVVLEAFRSGTEGVVDDGAFTRGGQDSPGASRVNFDGIY
jgi:penicillin-binding protein 1A